VIGGVGSEPVTVLTTSDGGTTWTREGWASTPTSPKPKVLGAVFVAHLSCSTTACMVATPGAYNMNQPGVAQLAQMAR
jgi:hypothetical protein